MNPELQRNLWLEITPHRLVLLPAVILASGALLHALDPSNTIVRSIALFGFIILTMVWGARQAANSVLEEARDRTWDIQRMAALSPWSMTWGKLAGATVMSWYGGLWCLLLFIGVSGAAAGLDVLSISILVVAVAIVAQGLALIGALVGLHRGKRAQARLSNFVVVLLLIFALPSVLSLTTAQHQLSWYGDDYRQLPFSTCAAAVFAGWTVLGAMRTMCMELRVRTRPWWWLVFTFFVAGFAIGFAAIEPRVPLGLLRGLLSTVTIAAIGQSYVAAFSFPCDPIQYRRVLRALADGDYTRALEELPLWLSSAALALIVAVAATVLGAAPEITNERPDNLGPTALAAVLMMTRDLALLSFFSLRLRGGRAEATTLVYIAILDGLLPALLPRLGLDALVGLVRPTFFVAPIAAIGVMIVHAAIASALAVSAYRQTMAAVNEKPGG